MEGRRRTTKVLMCIATLEQRVKNTCPLERRWTAEGFQSGIVASHQLKPRFQSELGKVLDRREGLVNWTLVTESRQRARCMRLGVWARLRQQRLSMTDLGS